MDAKNERAVQVVAEEARKTFLAIRNLRKTMPTTYAYQRGLLKDAIKKEQDAWWDKVKHLMTHDTSKTQT